MRRLSVIVLAGMACARPPAQVEPPLMCVYAPSVLSPREVLPPDVGSLPNAFLQRSVSDMDGCKQAAVTAPPLPLPFAFPQCSQRAVVRGRFEGFSAAPFPQTFKNDAGEWVQDGDKLHDGDSGGDLFPSSMGLPVTDDAGRPAVAPFDIRNDDFNGGAVHLEWRWCRQFTGQVDVPEEAKNGTPIYAARSYDFSPSDRDEVAAVGEWVMDFSAEAMRRGEIMGGKTELHETWMFAAREPDALADGGLTLEDGGTPFGPAIISGTVGRAYDFRVSAHMPTPAIQSLALQARIPPRLPDEAGLTNFGCRLIKTVCPQPGVSVDFATDVDAVSGGLVTFTLNLPNSQSSRNALATPYSCERESSCGNPSTTTEFRTLLAQRGGCGDFPNGGLSDAERPVFAGVFRCNWEDPIDFWSCDDCSAENPAAAGAHIRAPAAGCVQLGLDPNSLSDQQRACAEVCGGLVCGDGPACKLGVCRAPLTSTPSARLLAREACEPPTPLNRVSPMGDYRVEIGSGSTVQLGTIDAEGHIDSFAPIALVPTAGVVWLNRGRPGNPAAPSLELGFLELHAPTFSFLATHTAAEGVLFSKVRSRGERQGDGSFVFPAGSMRLVVRATVDGQPGGLDITSQGDVISRFDGDAFVLDATGRTDDGYAAKIHLVGVATNHPPVARVTNSTFECSSMTSTAFVLDATPSTDPDPGDGVVEYQWFKIEMKPEGDEGEIVPVMASAGIGPRLSVREPLGASTYDLHVYDSRLGSGAAQVSVQVVDTSGPTVNVPVDTFCLWPPNHDFVLFRLADELHATATDRCDAAPALRIVGVQSTEAVNAIGSGNTSPDVVFGPTTACVRSERTGGGSGRQYDVTLEAVDATGNATRRTVRVLVPHDKASHPGCESATGLPTPDARCTQ